MVSALMRNDALSTVRKSAYPAITICFGWTCGHMKRVKIGDWARLKVDEGQRGTEDNRCVAVHHHRIMVPSDDDDDTTVKAIDLKVGSWVMCSDHMAKKLIGKREYLAARLRLRGQFAL